MFTSLHGPEEVIKELLGSTVTTDHGNYAAIVAGNLDRNGGEITALVAGPDCTKVKLHNE